MMKAYDYRRLYSRQAIGGKRISRTHTDYTMRTFEPIEASKEDLNKKSSKSS